jgi:hypothetical protein
MLEKVWDREHRGHVGAGGGGHSGPRGLPSWVQGSKDRILNLVSNNSGISEVGGLATWRLGSGPAIELF